MELAWKFKVLIEIQTIRSIAVRKGSDSDRIRIRSCFPLQNAGKCQDFYKLHFVFESHTNTAIFSVKNDTGKLTTF